jgi:uncharacterized protein
VSEHAFTQPIPDDDSLPYWEALRRHELLFQRCGACGHAQWYFRAMCAACWSRDLERVAASGAGTVYSFTEVHQSADPALQAELPFTLALVELAEGPRVLGRIEEGTVAIGDAVMASFRDIGEWTLLTFRPTGADG